LADRILVLGGYGVFGGRLSRRLVTEITAEIFVAGRFAAKAAEHCRKFGGTPLGLDREGDLTAAFLDLKPGIVIDAAGPFQDYKRDRYRVARAAIAVGAHYIDLADDAEFVAGVGILDDLAKAAGVCVVSGASSVPAISPQRSMI
jgi:saccharopine dehydrogenase-like NADP-dependent oxidoreductase